MSRYQTCMRARGVHFGRSRRSARSSRGLRELCLTRCQETDGIAVMDAGAADVRLGMRGGSTPPTMEEAGNS